MKYLTEKGKKEMESHDWEVRSKGFWIKLLPEDFGDYEIWVGICEDAGADPDSQSICVLCFGVYGEK